MVPEGWAESRLEELTAQSVTYGVVKPGDERTGGVPFVRGGDFPDGKIKIAALRTISPEISSGYKRTVLKGGEILVSLVGYPGATAIVPPELSGANIARQAALVRPNGKVSRDYLFHFLRSPIGQKRMLSQSIGSAQQVINLKDLKSVNVALPPLPEQKKIAEILSTWDRAIETAEALLATARTQKRGLMQTLLTGKRRFPEFEGQEWREVRLGDVTKVIVSNVDKKTVQGERPVRLCNYTDVYKRDFIEPSQHFMDATATEAQVKKFGLKVGDVVVTKDSETADEIAMPTYVAETEDDLVCGYHLTIVRPGKSVDGHFLKFVFEMPHTRYYFGTRANGAIRFGLTIDGITGAKFNLPPLEEQRRIASVIVGAEQEISKLTASIEKLRSEKKALMQQLLTGKRRVAV